MAAGDVTQGTRREAGTSFPDLVTSEYALSIRADALRAGQIGAVLPNGHFVLLQVAEGPAPADARTWGFSEHEDGSLSLHPSVNLHPTEVHSGWHGFLERGVWREV